MQEYIEAVGQMAESPDRFIEATQTGTSAVAGAVVGYLEGKEFPYGDGSQRLGDNYLVGTAVGALQPAAREVYEHLYDIDDGIVADAGGDLLAYEGARSWGFKYAKRDSAEE